MTLTLDQMRDMLDIQESLNTAIMQAHRGRGFTVKELEGMSAMDLLLVLAPNNVRFYYLPPKWLEDARPAD